MKNMELSHVYSKFNFAKRFITDYMHRIFEEYLKGEARAESSSVLEVLSEALKGINLACCQLDQICDEEAEKFFQKHYKNAVFAAIVQLKKDVHWCTGKLSIYPIAEYADVEQVNFIPAIYYASRANVAALRKAEIDTIKMLRDNEKVITMQLPIMQLYKTLTTQDDLFFIDKDIKYQYNDIFNIIFCSLNSGRLLVSSTKPTKFLQNIRDYLNSEFIIKFNDYYSIVQQYDELAEKYIALASDAWNDAFEKIKLSKKSSV